LCGLAGEKEKTDKVRIFSLDADKTREEKRLGGTVIKSC